MASMGLRTTPTRLDTAFWADWELYGATVEQHLAVLGVLHWDTDLSKRQNARESKEEKVTHGVGMAVARTARAEKATMILENILSKESRVSGLGG